MPTPFASIVVKAGVYAAIRSHRRRSLAHLLVGTYLFFDMNIALLETTS